MRNSWTEAKISMCQCLFYYDTSIIAWYFRILVTTRNANGHETRPCIRYPCIRASYDLQARTSIRLEGPMLEGKARASCMEVSVFFLWELVILSLQRLVYTANDGQDDGFFLQKNDCAFLLLSSHTTHRLLEGPHACATAHIREPATRDTQTAGSIPNMHSARTYMLHVTLCLMGSYLYFDSITSNGNKLLLKSNFPFP